MIHHVYLERKNGNNNKCSEKYMAINNRLLNIHNFFLGALWNGSRDQRDEQNEHIHILLIPTLISDLFFSWGHNVAELSDPYAVFFQPILKVNGSLAVSSHLSFEGKEYPLIP